MKHESYDLVEFKADETDSGRRGLFAALVSVFNNVDRHGDRVVPGAFKKSIAKWRESGNPVPVVWSHEHKDPDAYIGSVDPSNLKETDRGLVVAGQLDIEDNPKARRIYDLLANGRLKQWSFAYEVKDERIAEDLARELVELDLFEVGPTLVGANAEAMTLAVKAAELEEAGSNEPQLKLDPLISDALARFDGDIDKLLEEKVGRVISSKTEAKVRAAMAALTDILAALGEEVPAEQASSSPEAKADEPKPPGEKELLRLGLSEVGSFLAARGR